MATAPFAFFDLDVLRTTRLGPGFLRVTLGGGQIAAVGHAGRDQRIKLFVPHPGQRTIAVPRDDAANWWTAWQRMHPAERAFMRTYTVRELRRDAGELDIDFALHPHPGPASSWATRVRPGDPATILGPVEDENAGIGFHPPAATDAVLLAGDASALPAIAGILAWLPPGTPATVLVETTDPADHQHLPTRADADITWLTHPAVPHPASEEDPLLTALRATPLPGSAPYAWIAGEASSVRALRRHLVGERGMDRRHVTFTGYWRRHASEDTLIQEAIAATA
ncbi:siderophore-interacting protein [Streptomyces avicenniae]|uniref:siderophore-interacting protein n=1 Tax=Streptomyces avicenniae TaxID=500153 RepID=UPI00069C8225|nr:siderophore-interacting protein [Streptomyces avicenniae]